MRIIDGNNLIHRVADKSFGIHPVRELFGRLYSPPETTIIVWDGPYANKRRKELLPEYKATRRPKEESKIKFFDLAKAVVNFTPIIQVEIPGWEADDIIGTLINRYHQKYPLTVETTDGDFWQHKDKCKLPLVSNKWEKFSAQDCLLYKATVGEAKDNIKGISGFGQVAWDKLSASEKTALKIAHNESSLTKFEDALKWPPRCQPLDAAFEQFQLSWKLNTCWPVPHSEIDKHTVVGRPNLQAAEIFMQGYLI